MPFLPAEALLESGVLRHAVLRVPVSVHRSFELRRGVDECLNLLRQAAAEKL